MATHREIWFDYFVHVATAGLQKVPTRLHVKQPFIGAVMKPCVVRHNAKEKANAKAKAKGKGKAKANGEMRQKPRVDLPDVRG